MAQSTSDHDMPPKIHELLLRYQRTFNAEYHSEHGQHVGPIPNPALAWTGFDHSPQYTKFYTTRTKAIVKAAERCAQTHDIAAQYDLSLSLPLARNTIRDAIEANLAILTSGSNTIRGQIEANLARNPFSGNRVNPAPNAPVRLAPLTIRFCQVLVSIDDESRIAAGAIRLLVDGKPTENVMCGEHFRNEKDYKQHILSRHPGAIQNTPTFIEENSLPRYAADKALRNYALTQEWRRARFHKEPGKGLGLEGKRPAILKCCDELEELARYFPFFRQTYGTVFHRDETSILSSPENPDVVLL